jgi:S-DNA-T family DNA segregation ATPase FtsK/SpoIIIE
VSKVAHAVVLCCYTIFVRPPLFFIAFIQSLLDGDAFNDTGLVVPDESPDELNNDAYIYNDQPRYVSKQVLVDFFVVSLQQRKEGGLLKSPLMFVNKFRTSAEKTSQKQKPYTASVRDHDEEPQEISPGIIKDTAVHSKKSSPKTPQYALPHMNIFIAEKDLHQDAGLEKELQERAHVLQDKLKRFGVAGEVVAIKRGPVVTVFEYQPDVDTKLSKIVVLEDDLAMALQAMSIRILAPIPGRSVVGFEVANSKRNDVLFSQIATSPDYTNFSGSLPLVLGKGTIGEVVVVDLARMPHLLIAGSTGSGKSVALNAILISLLCKLSPDELKLILIDPKRLEFASFTDIAHLLFPIVTSPHHAAPVLRWVVQEMEERYEKMAQRGARNVADYNARVQNQPYEEGVEPAVALPFIVVVIDELADLMITTGRDIEDLITRITQMARAAGIHMIVATQRPSVDVITGLIKANFPSRISFRVASRIDSRTILDTMGADRLLGRGDMLFLDAATSQLRRVHGAYVSDEEIERVADHIRLQRKVEYLDRHHAIATQANDLHQTDDVLYQDVRQFLDEIDEISISLLQRKFRIGYNRSARIIDMLESQGLIMPQDGGKTRKVIR